MTSTSLTTCKENGFLEHTQIWDVSQPNLWISNQDSDLEGLPLGQTRAYKPGWTYILNGINTIPKHTTKNRCFILPTYNGGYNGESGRGSKPNPTSWVRQGKSSIWSLDDTAAMENGEIGWKTGRSFAGMELQLSALQLHYFSPTTDSKLPPEINTLSGFPKPLFAWPTLQRNHKRA